MVVILNGVGRSGKGTVYEDMNKLLPGVWYSWVEKVRTMLRENGVDVDNKTPEMRRLLAGVCSAFDEMDLNFNDVKRVILDVENWKYDQKRTAYIDIRDPKNIDKIKKFCKALGIDCFTVYVKRDVECPDNAADIAASNTDYKYDYVIDNNGTLEELEAKCEKIIHEIFSVIWDE